jgi:uncharacterized membrane protein YidH (DUF202 family)
LIAYWEERQKDSMGVLLILFGLIAILAGIFGKDFHNADVIAQGEFKQKSSIWSGRTVFIVVGVGLIVGGVKLVL